MVRCEGHSTPAAARVLRAGLSLALILGASAPALGAMRFNAPIFHRFTLGAGGPEVGRHAAFVDLDRDGRSDLVVGSSSLYTRPLRRLRGRGGGDFEAPVFLASGESPAFVDLDRDGALDMVTSYYGRTISAFYHWTSLDVLRGRGNGAFDKVGGGTFSSYTPSPIVVGDFDGDSLADMIVSLTGTPSHNQGAPPSRVLAYYGVGGVYFTAPQEAPFPAGVPMAAGDMNGDGRDDLALGIGGQAVVYPGRADRSWTSPVSHVMTGSGAIRVLSSADLNRDGRDDLLASIIGPAGVPGLLATRLQRSDGTLGGPDDFATTPTDALPGAILPGDWNEDGHLDVGVWATDGARGVLSLLANDGTGALSYRGRTGEGRVNGTPAMADVSGDGHLDLAIAEDGGAAILWGLGDGRLGMPKRYGTSPAPAALAIADLDRDGYSDVVTNALGGLGVFRGGSGSVLTPSGRVLDSGSSSTAAIGDFDGDGLIDVAGRSPGANEIMVAFGEAAGGFSSGARVAMGDGTQSFDAGDVDGDGRADLVSVRRVHLNTFPAQAYDSVVVRCGLADRGFEPAQQYLVGGSARVVVRDLEGDGRADVFVEGSRAVWLLGSLPDGTLAAARQIRGSAGLRAVEDVNGDGVLDVLLDGVLPGLSSTTSIAAGDFDGDARVDLAAADGGNTVRFYRPASGGWSFDSEYVVGGSVSALAAADVDRDGRLDLLGLDASQATLSLISNAGPASRASVVRVTPAAGSVGARVVVRGTGFSSATRVTFGGVDASFEIRSHHEIAAVVPPGARSGDVVVTNPHGTGSGRPFALAPSFRDVEPPSARVGDMLLVRGSNLTGASAASIGGVTANFTVTTDSTIQVVVPRAARTGVVRIVHPHGPVQSPTPVAILPTVLAYDPARGFAGDTIRIRGYTFGDVRSVAFAGVEADHAAVSDSVIQAIVPRDAVTGPVSVTTVAGTTVATRDFIVRDELELRVMRFHPPAGRAGSLVVIEGASFVGVDGVAFAGAAASFEVQASDRLVARVPRGAVSGPITVSRAGGVDVTRGSFLVRAAVEAMNPIEGPIATIVTLAGTGFTGATAVRFGDLSATFSVPSDSVLTTRVPGGALSALITIEKPGTIDTAGVFTVVGDNLAMVVTQFSPPSGPIGGGVVIEGMNFVGLTSVRFGAIPASFQVHGPERLVAEVPRNARSDFIIVTGERGSVATAQPFFVSATISKMRPLAGPVGTQVRLEGSGFLDAALVLFNGTPARFTLSGDSLIDTEVPPGATTGAVTVENSGYSGMAGVFRVETGPPVSSQLALEPPWPNPVRERVTMFIAVPAGGARLAIFDLSGSRVRDERLPPGSREWTWSLEDEDRRKVRPGLYLIELRSGSVTRTRRVVVL